MLYESGWTDELMRPIEHTQLPSRARCGLTNLVDRVTASESELSIDEKRDSVPALVRKIAQHKPRFLCFVGKVRAECIARESLTRQGIAGEFGFVLKPHMGLRSLETTMGLQSIRLVHGDLSVTYVFVMPSSSGIVRGKWQVCAAPSDRADRAVPRAAAAGEGVQSDRRPPRSWPGHRDGRRGRRRQSIGVAQSRR